MSYRRGDTGRVPPHRGYIGVIRGVYSHLTTKKGVPSPYGLLWGSP